MKQGVRLRALVEQIARMTKDGEEVDGEPYEMGIDDAIETLNRLIDKARGALKGAPGLSPMAVIAIGNPFDGITLYGPYQSSEDANAEADTIRDSEWWVTELQELET